MIRAVLFDAVGTLVRPWPSVGSIYARAAAAHGLRLPVRVLEAAFHAVYRELFPGRFFGPSRLQTSEARERAWWRRVVALSMERAGCARPPAAALDDAFAEFSRGRAWRLAPGAIETLGELGRRGVAVAIVSNYDARLHRVVDELGLAPRLAAVLASSEVGWAKPAPRIYRAALDRLGVAPGGALMVGDRRREDYEGARAAGLNAVLYDPRGTAGGSVPSIRDLRRVPALLRGW